MKWWQSCCLAAVFAAAACGGGNPASSSPAAPSSSPPAGPGPTSHGSMSATIDGVRWDATIIQVGAASTIFSVAGMDKPTAPFGALSFGVPAKVGTYPFGSTTGTQDAGFQDGAGKIWQASFIRGSGSVTLSTLTGNYASGTFTIDLAPVAGSAATGTKVVRNGTFNVTF